MAARSGQPSTPRARLEGELTRLVAAGRPDGAAPAQTICSATTMRSGCFRPSLVRRECKKAAGRSVGSDRGPGGGDGIQRLCRDVQSALNGVRWTVPQRFRPSDQSSSALSLVLLAFCLAGAFLLIRLLSPAVGGTALKEASCQSNLRQIRRRSPNCCADNDGAFPTAPFPSVPPSAP